jgi:hypothetical protein
VKIALCLYGKFTGKNDRGEIQGFTEPFKYFNENVITDDVDVFLHGWDDDESSSKNLIELVKPKKYLLEKQRQFNHPFTDYNFTPNGTWNTQKGIFNNYSRFYSLKECVSLVDDSYDIIIISRFDTIFYEKLNYSLLDKDKFYITNWHKNNERWGVNDAWFIGGNKLMKEFSLIYDRLEDYFDLDGGFLRYIKSYGLTEKNITSGHALWRYRLHETNIENNTFTIGLEYETWGLLRRINQRKNMWWNPKFNYRVPNKLL